MAGPHLTRRLCAPLSLWRYCRAPHVVSAPSRVQMTSRQVPMGTVCMGQCSHLPRSAIPQLHEWGRWTPVTVPMPPQFGFTHFAYVTPSEFIGDHIFPRSGGFAYLHKDDYSLLRDKDSGKEEFVLTSLQNSLFYPVVNDQLALDDITTDKYGKFKKVNKVVMLLAKY